MLSTFVNKIVGLKLSLEFIDAKTGQCEVRVRRVKAWSAMAK